MSVAPNFSVHNFKCPDCERNCQLIQDGKRASMRHQLPACKTYEATKKDGQKFLELAFIATPAQEVDRLLVAFRERKNDDPAGAALEAAVQAAKPPVEEVPAPPTPQPQHEPIGEATGPVRDWTPPQVTHVPPPPAHWQMMLDGLMSHLTALLSARRRHAEALAAAIAEAQRNPSAPKEFQGFDDAQIAAVAQAIISICQGAKGHP